MNKKKNARMLTPEESRKMLGGQLSFAAAEAYKLLRTNLNFSVPDKNGCRVIGVTSSIQGEGKSTTSINMAYTLAESGQKVLLIEADLRLPTVCKRLRLNQSPGLSNLLAGQVRLGDTLQVSPLLNNLIVMSAGDVPPNPAELLGSPQMETLVNALSTRFDAIIFDLPPVMVVTDALLISRLVSGYVLVVRQNVCDKGALDNVVRQMEFVHAKILGFVMTGADYHQKSYKHYGNYGSGDHYETAQKAASEGKTL